MNFFRSCFGRFLFTILILGCLFNPIGLFSTQQAMGTSGFYDMEASDVSWVHDSARGWCIVTIFEKACVIYYFKQGPTRNEGLCISSENPPYKIEFKDEKTGKIFSMTNISFSQSDDGKKAYLGYYNKKFKLNDEQFKAISVVIQETRDKLSNKVHYHVFKDNGLEVN